MGGSSYRLLFTFGACGLEFAPESGVRSIFDGNERAGSTAGVSFVDDPRAGGELFVCDGGGAGCEFWLLGELSFRDMPFSVGFG
jgi:hypothetical protein